MGLDCKRRPIRTQNDVYCSGLICFSLRLHMGSSEFPSSRRRRCGPYTGAGYVVLLFSGDSPLVYRPRGARDWGRLASFVLRRCVHAVQCNQIAGDERADQRVSPGYYCDRNSPARCLLAATAFAILEMGWNSRCRVHWHRNRPLHCALIIWGRDIARAIGSGHHTDLIETLCRCHRLRHPCQPTSAKPG